MLKIKDNVDLKELEKFGFKKNIIGEYELYFKNSSLMIKSNFNNMNENEDINRLIITKDREVYIHCNTYISSLPIELMYLFKLDFVEEVSNE